MAPSDPITPVDNDAVIEAARIVARAIHFNQIDLSAALIAAFKDIRVVSQLTAGQTSAAWIAEHADKVDPFATRYEMLLHLMTQDIPDGDLAEFGVFTGAVTRLLRPHYADRAYHAFDSFLGVPETMGLAIRAGDFTLGGNVPDLPPDTTVHAGWFDKTVPAFRENFKGRLAFVYIDCDLYESVSVVLENLHGLFADNAIVAFDDWYNFPNWQAHSKRAVDELVERTGLRFTPAGVCVREHSVAFRVTRP
jgi:hypothetical protein